MTRFLMFCSGLVLMGSLSGCCLFPGYGGCGGACGGAGYGAGYPYNSGFGAPAGGCANGACGASAPGYPSAFAPMGTQSAYIPPTTALVEPMSTYN